MMGSMAWHGLKIWTWSSAYCREKCRQIEKKWFWRSQETNEHGIYQDISRVKKPCRHPNISWGLMFGWYVLWVPMTPSQEVFLAIWQLLSTCWRETLAVVSWCVGKFHFKASMWLKNPAFGTEWIPLAFVAELIPLRRKNRWNSNKSTLPKTAQLQHSTLRSRWLPWHGLERINMLVPLKGTSSEHPKKAWQGES